MNRMISLTVGGILLAALVACGGGSTTSSSSTTTPPTLASMAGAWDFAAVGGGGNPVQIQAILTQDAKGNISSAGTVTATGPAGSVSEFDIIGATLATATDMSVDYLGNTCGTDSGNRTITGTINTSNQVTLTFDSGGSFKATITGTLTPTGTQQFTGTFSVAAPGCKSNGQSGTVLAVPASPLSGTYSGTNAGITSETMSVTVTQDATGKITGTGTDSTNGAFTFTGSSVANGFAVATTFATTPANNGTVFGYFDTKLGAKGSILLVSFEGATATSCPNGVPIDNGSCLIAVLAKQ